MTQFNWDTFSNEELARLIRNGGVTAGFDTDFNRELVEESARRIERATQLEAERDAVLERERIELIEWAARVNEQFKHRLQTQLELDTARAAIVRYQDERMALLGRIETLAEQLRNAERTCFYWLHEGRFAVANSDEAKYAVGLLKHIVEHKDGNALEDETPLGKEIDGQGDEVEP